MKSCLIVDDSSVVRMAIKRMLEPFFPEIKEAADGKQALEKCNESMPSVIMLDWNMPVMSGIDFLIELRKTDTGKKPIVILCTTEKDFGHIEKAIKEGANEYIMKPFNETIIKSKLEMLGVL